MNYLENSKTALQALNETYYVKGTFKGSMFWDRAELTELIEDACEKLGDEYKTQLQEMVNTSIVISTEDWSRNPYYDDILWLCLAFTRAGVILDNPRYIEIAKNNFDYITRNGISVAGEATNLVKWKVDVDGGNTISSTLYSVVASLLGKALNDQSYLEKSKIMLDEVMSKLFNASNGHVFNSVGVLGKKDFFAHDNNFGMFIRACSEVYEYTEDEKYFEAMKSATEHLITLKYKSDLMCNHDTGDGAGFKAIFIRQVGYVANKYGIEDYLEWLKFNAEAAWNNRNKYNLMQNDFCTKTADHRLYRAFDCQTAVTLLISCI